MHPGTFSPPPRVSDPDMHQGLCVTHVPWCMLGSQTSGFLWNQWRGKCSRHSRHMRNPQFYVSGKRSIVSMLIHFLKCFCLRKCPSNKVLNSLPLLVVITVMALWFYHIIFQARNVPWLPNLVLGILSLAVGLTTLLLPETRHWPLPQSIADVHKYAKGNFPKAATESQSYTIWRW